MSIFDRDFSQINAKAVAAGSKAQCDNVLQAALDDIKRLRRALEFYRNGFQYHPKRSKTGIGMSEWRPTVGLLEDCGNVAKEALEISRAHQVS